MKRILPLLITFIGSFLSVSAQYCTPSAATGPTQAVSSCGGTAMRIQAFNVTGASGAIADAAACNSTGYLDRTTLSTTFYKGSTYSASLTTGSSNNVYAQAWVDFNNDFVFSAGETIGGWGTAFINTANFPLTIPAGAPTGTFRMRVLISWTGNGATYPSINPCMTGYSYGEARDYTVTITPPPPAVATSVSSLAFGNVAVSATSSAQVFSMTGTFMTSTPVTVATSSSNFEFSFNNTTWFSTPQTYSFSLPGFTSIPIYVRFTPSAATSYLEYINITGGGLAVTKSVAVLGSGANPCSGTPVEGTASVMPMAGNITTPFTLSTTGYSPTSGITFQWQSSPTGLGSWTDISGATNATHSFTGISAATYYRCNVTCSISSTTVATNVVSATLFPASSCTPAFSTNSCPTNAMNASIASLLGVGSSIVDPSSGCSGAIHYFDNSGTMSCTLLKGSTYNPTINLSNSTNNYGVNMSVQIWIDFNGDGAFTNTEAVGGTALASGTVAGVTSLPITIPSGAPTGTFRMRIEGNYQSTTYTTYPTMNPCPTTATTYGQVRDYKVNIIPPPACTTPLTQAAAPFTFSSTLFTINGSFSAAPTSTENYLVVMTTSSVAPTAPTDGTTYTVGATALGGKIISASSLTTFTATGLSDNTPYWFWVYSYNSGCTGGPKYLTASPLNGTTSTTACAMSGVKTVGPTGDYATIAAAITAINSVGLAGNLALELQTTYTGETYPITIGAFTCASASRRLTIRPQGTMTITANTTTPMISLSGANYVTIDGRVGSTGSTKALTLINTNTTTSAASTIQFINDASNNIVKHMTLRGANISTAGGVLQFSTTTGTTGSDNNLVDSSDIMEAIGFALPLNCIYAQGTSGKENSGNTISNCKIANFYNTSTQAAGIMISSGNSDWTITGNRIYQDAARAYTSSQTVYGIFVNNTASGNNFTISNNIIGYSTGTGTGTYTFSSTSSTNFTGIFFQGGTVTASNINGNIITNISATYSASTGAIIGINVPVGSVNIGTGSGNTIGAATGNGAIFSTGPTNGAIAVKGISCTAATPAVINISNNTIGSINAAGTATSGSYIYGIELTNTASVVVNNNTIGSTSTANSITSSATTSGQQQVYGILNSLTSGVAVAPVISNNVISNITQVSTSASSFLAGINANSSASVSITGNTVSNLTGASSSTSTTGQVSVQGILCAGNTLPYVTISGNTISGIYNTNTTTSATYVCGISTNNARDPYITQNKIYDIRNASTGTTVTNPPQAIGILIGSPTTTAATGTVVANNMVTLGNGISSNTSFTGIMNNASTALTFKIYYNTVSISGTSTGGLHSACFMRGNYVSTFTTPMDIRNNIFTNSRSAGTGKHYAIANAIGTVGSTSGWGSAASNYNILNSANAATIGFWSNADQTFASWKTASLCDNNSTSGSAVTFTNVSTGDLHINMGITANNIESHGTVISGFSTDYDNHARPGPAGSVNGGGFGVDVGADEFDGVAIDNIPPVINYTNSTCGSTGNFTFTATVADLSGVPTTGVLMPRVYYRKGAGAWFSNVGSLTSGSGTNGTWTFTILASDMGGLAAGNIVSYYVIAQDNTTAIGSNPSTGLVATDVNTVSTPPTAPATYTVGLNSSYTVGSGGDFTTITNAVAAYNGGCLTGPVTFNLITTTYPSETFPITINNNAFASATNTLTIKPAASVAAVVNGPNTISAIFKLLNARYVTLDGVNTGGASLTLNSIYTASTFANIWLASTSGTGPGCRNITLKNMNIVGGSNSITSAYGILAGLDNGSNPTTSSGMDNDTITITGNTITKCYYGVYATGATSVSNGGLNDWTIGNNIIGPATSSSTDNIGLRGVNLTNMLNLVMSGNTIRNIGTTTLANQSAGIYLSSAVNGVTITGNTITDITSNYSGTSTLANCGIYLGSTVINSNTVKNTIRGVSNIYPSSGGAARGIMLNTANSATNALIANNMISDIKCFSQTSISFAPIGIDLEGTNGFVKIYYNTVNLNSSFAGYNAATMSACFYTASAGPNIDLRNNNFVNTFDNTTVTSDKGWALYTTVANSSFNEMDYNNYYAPAPNVMAFISADRVNLAAIQSFYGRNANCISVAPVFVSGTDMRLQTVSGNAALAAGTPVTVTNDIDGTTRSGSNPVIGAHEVQFCSSITAGSVAPAVSAFCASGSTTVTATGATVGESMQWRSSTDGSTWTTITGATNASYVTPTITTTTFYRFVNKCSSTTLADSATATVTINSLPAAIGGTLTLCPTGTTTLTNSTGGGTWSSSTTGVGTIESATGVLTGITSGTTTVSYTITATGCYSTTIVTANALPTVANITPSVPIVCIGGSLTLNAGSVTGTGSLVSYNWTGPNSFSTTTSGVSTAFTTTTTASSGNYSLSVTYAGSGCTSSSVASTAVTVNTVPSLSSITALPTPICVNDVLTLTASGATGTGSIVSYNWTGPNSYSSTSAGASQTYTLPSTAAAGSYSASVTYPGTGCTSPAVASAAISVVPAPNVYNVTGGGVVCSGANVHIGLDWSILGINYQLYNGASLVGSPVLGSTSALDFGLIGVAGTYTVKATNATSGCTSNMAGSATVTVNPLPTAFNVTGGGTTCENSGAVSVGLSNSVSGFTYQLYNGASTAGSPVAGTGAAISFGSQNTSGTYTVLATNNTTSCTNAMTGSAVVVINPAPTAYTVTGGGSYCSGAAGLAVGVANSATGINYQLYNGAATVGSPVAGTGAAISFGSQTASGTYTVRGTNTVTSCPGGMTGSVAITINPLPTAYNVTGGGQYCAGGSGVAVGLSFSATGINYQLYNGAAAIGSPVAGTGAAISFGNQTLAGTYTVLATNTSTLCTNAMTSNAVVIMNALPTPQTVSGGGAFCTGGAGVAVGLNSSQTGISYQLYNGASTVGSPVLGTGSAISFGNQATAGSYSVVGTNTVTTCPNNMTGSVGVTVNPLPGQYVITGGGDYCAGGSGVAIGLNSSNTGISYQLYNGASVSGSPVSGTGAAISFGTRTASGSYSAVATNTVTSCASNMFGSTAVVINPLPTAYAMTGGGQYCAGGTGVAIGLANTNSGINYQLYSGGSTVGSPVAGTGAAISFGSHTAAGTYTVLATNSTTLCTNAMSGTATVIINALPLPQTVSGGGTYCQFGTGVAVGLTASQSGINYQLYNGATAMGSPVSGTGSAVSFGNQTLAGTYTVLATNATTSCTATMSGNAVVIMNPAPTAYTVTGGGQYCAGGSGVAVGLNNSSTGISYQLYNGGTAVGSPVNGTGSAISFGSKTLAATYTVLGTNTVTTCTNGMTSNAVVIMNPLPTAYGMNGGGQYCTGGTGVTVGLGNSQVGVNYRLYNGATAMGSLVAGTGSAISFGSQTLAGTYTVLATNAITSCTKAMTGSSTVIMNALPVVQSVTGGGNACSGGVGANVGLASSQIGVNYQAFIGSTAVTFPLGGTGAALDFGPMYAPGAYTMVGVNTTTGCMSNMSGSATVILNSPPVVYTVSGGGNYCSGGTGVSINLSNSSTSVSYRLYIGSTPIGSSINGTGAAMSMGSQTATGTYSIIATNLANTCTSVMAGTATVGINALPTAYTVTGGGNYCPGTGGANISLSGSGTGVTYQLYIGGSSIGGPVTGTGGTLNMGTYTNTGTYAVVGTNVLTGCVGNMTGSVAVAPYTAPAAYTVTGGGAYCSGSAGVAVGLGGSETGTTYSLYYGSSVLSTLAGTGSSLSFGLQTASGAYSVLATNNTTTCTAGMTGVVSVSVNPLPAVYVLSGGGGYCAGGSGFGFTLSGSAAGINYQLYNGASPASGGLVTGSGTSITFGAQTAAGVYSVSAINPLTGCTSAMAGAPSIIVNPLPNPYNVTGGGSYCAGGTGVNISLDGSGVGITYTLFNGSSPAATAIGSGGVLSFGLMSAAGNYTVRATNTSTTCVRSMTGSASVVVNPLPTIYTLTGGGGYCSGGAGSLVGLSWSTSGVNYQLYNGASPVGAPVAGINGELSFGLKTAIGTYSVVAVNTTSSCTKNMAGSVNVSINPLPSEYAVTGSGSYCSGAAGVNILLSGSETGVNYSLYNGAAVAGSPVAGTGSSLSFGPNTAGTYTVLATNATTLCQRAMTGTANVSANPLPIPYVVSGGGVHCAEAPGVGVYLSGSQSGVSYSLYNGATATGITIAGTGSSINFGLQDLAGIYSVSATNLATSCTRAMTGTATVSVNPVPNAYAVTGGGNYCSGGAGVPVGLAASQSGVLYQLYKGATAVGTATSGSGGAISFGLQTANGVYTVMAVNGATSCSKVMSGSVTVNSNPLPGAYSVLGGGAYCAGGSGVNVSLSSSSPGITYQLYNGASPVGSTTAGTGFILHFGFQAAAGTYTVRATDNTSLCTQAMSGNAVVGVNPLPVTQAVSGGGAYCEGAGGVPVGISGSQPGVLYTLYNGSSAAGVSVSGTGSAIDFGNMAAAGTYTVAAVNTSTSCSAGMAGTATVAVNPLPVEFDVVGGGGYCDGAAGVHIGLGNSQIGVNYQLYNGSSSVGGAVAGTDDMLDFGFMAAAGTYSVAAVNAASSCARGMAGEATVVINTPPVVYAITGGGNFCNGGSGVHIGLSGSDFGVSYQVYKDGVPVGAAVSGTGFDLDFGLYSATGSYSVMAANPLTTCTSAMSGSAVVGINDAPAVFAVSSGGSYCPGTSGVVVLLSNSEPGIGYRLYSGSVATGLIVSGTGAGIDFGLQPAGTYSVLAVNGTTSCSTPMTGMATITINTLPATFNLTGGGSYCDAGTGVAVGLTGSQTGVTYQLYNGTVAVGSSVPGTGGPLSFANNTAGVYAVAATNTVTSCVANMTGTAAITINALPNTYAVSGGGNFCSGGTGVSISLVGSQPGINYRLYNGTTPVGSLIAGSGLPINFGPQVTAGIYTVRGVNASTSCAATMVGSAAVVVNPLPVAFSITGGGGYCPGTTGVNIGLSGSQENVSYQLYSGSSMAGIPATGTGTVIDLGVYTAGTYSVVATDMTTTCSSGMTGSATVVMNTQPTAYTLTSSGTGYCTGGSGVLFTLGNSQTSVTYRLYNGTTPVSPVVNGTGSSLNFGLKTLPGTYTAIATNILNGCTTTMTGAPSVAIHPLPSIHTVTGGGSFCTGEPGVPVMVSGSQTGINYQLYNGSSASGTAMAGTGSAISFTAAASGTYTVVAIDPATNCRSNMSGSASVMMNPLPATHTVTGGGQYCAGGAGLHVGLSTSTAGIRYMLYNGATAASFPITSTGGSIDFGTQTGAGVYTVMATNPVSGCSAGMTGSATVSINLAPAPQSVTGGGPICVGTAAAIGLGGSATGVNYRVYNGASPVGVAMAGTGGVMSLGSYSAPGTYTVLATDAATSCTRAMTGNVVVTVNSLPEAHLVIGGGNYCSGGSGVTVGLGNSTSGVSYKLYRGSAVAATMAGSGFSLSFGTFASTGVYTVQAIDAATGCTRAMSGSAVVGIAPSVVPAVALTSAPGDTLCAGTPAVLTTSVVNEGTSPVYSWKVNGVDVSAASSSYSYTPADGDEVTVTMTSNAACAVPATATDAVALTVKANQLPVVTTSLSLDDTLCEGTSITFTANALYGGDSPVFQWLKNGVPAGSSATFTYTPVNGDVIYCRMTSNYVCRSSSMVNGEKDTMSVIVPLAPTVNIMADPGTSISKGQMLTLTAAATNTYMPSYQWYLNGALVHGATTKSFTYGNYENKDTVSCRVANNTPCGDFATVNTVMIDVSNVGVANVNNAKFDVRLVPNPTKGDFTITGTISGIGTEDAAVEITDMLGQVVYTGKAPVKNGSINAAVQLNSGLANGMYMVSLRTATATKVFHLVFQQ